MYSTDKRDGRKRAIGAGEATAYCLDSISWVQSSRRRWRKFAALAGEAIRCA